MKHELVAAVDLGSNSFRLQIGRIVKDQIYPLDGYKESVRLAAGLSREKVLSEEAQQRGLLALRRFNERLTDFAPDSVRAVGTNTLRVAKNAPEFLMRAQMALGFPIEVIAGREEARLIYVGVAHTLPDPHRQQLVVDIGGGSTEFIIGKSFRPQHLESLYMGCVSYSLNYFPDGRINKTSLKTAETAARRELQVLAHAYRTTGWDEAVGSSGSVKALVEILEGAGFPAGEITRDGLEWLRVTLLKAGDINKLDVAGLREDRVPVLFGGFAIMSAIFKELALERMVFSEGALRQGVLYDLLGRYHHADLRDATVNAFMERYGVNRRQAGAVTATAEHLFNCVVPPREMVPDDEDQDLQRRFLRWATQLHEIGISVAHSSYHKHSAYILAHADMPGFSKMDQARLASIVLGHRGKLMRLNLNPANADWLIVACLRLATLIHRARDYRGVPPMQLALQGLRMTLTVSEDWLRRKPLTAAALEDERAQWQAVGIPFEMVRRKKVVEEPALPAPAADQPMPPAA